jgi:ABC-type uncharacterized transport system fused permease/ATPase subunit
LANASSVLVLKGSEKTLAYVLLIIVVVAITMFGQLRLNAWNRPFYDAIAQKSFEDFLIQLGVFCMYAFAASFLSWRVGKPLIPLNADRYAREAEFRFSLVYLNEHIAEFNGDAIHQKPKLLADLRNVLQVWWRIVNANAWLTFVTAGYGWFATIAPILAAAPGYFAGNLTFGELMMVAGAFTQVQTSLRWFIDNFGVIADWRATLLRIADFRAALIGYPPLPDGKTARILDLPDVVA